MHNLTVRENMIYLRNWKNLIWVEYRARKNLVKNETKRWSSQKGILLFTYLGA